MQLALLVITRLYLASCYESESLTLIVAALNAASSSLLPGQLLICSIWLSSLILARARLANAYNNSTSKPSHWYDVTVKPIIHSDFVTQKSRGRRSTSDWQAAAAACLPAEDQFITLETIATILNAKSRLDQKYNIMRLIISRLTNAIYILSYIIKLLHPV